MTKNIILLGVYYNEEKDFSGLVYSPNHIDTQNRKGIVFTSSAKTKKGRAWLDFYEENKSLFGFPVEITATMEQYTYDGKIQSKITMIDDIKIIGTEIIE